MTRYPPWDPKARLHLHVGCPYCWDDDPDAACDCPCHEEDREDEGDVEGEGARLTGSGPVSSARNDPSRLGCRP